jgi:hypothetical protein
MYKLNTIYLNWIENNPKTGILILVLLIAIMPTIPLLILILIFILFRMMHEDGNWWYEWSDLDEMEGDHIEERDNTTGC